MNTIKALFFDVDNTIYTHRIHDFPASTQQALNRLKDKGYRIGVATSRCRYEVSNLPSFFREFPFDAAIFDGGALVMGEQEVIASFPLQQEQVYRLISHCEQKHIPVRYSTFDKDCLTTPCPHSIRDEFFKLYMNMPTVKPYEGEEVYNMLAYPQDDIQRKQIKELMKDAFIVTHSSNTLEITAENVDKSKGVEAMAAHWGISVHDVACFGDGANDVGMLRAAGIGVAMGNGNPKAKTAADHICGSIDEDGLYHFCKRMEWI
ncbi:HAD family hydrolase [[Clostridium] innocuum]|nr:HAD family hydrolase [[Clostridium] innocuum]